MAKGLKKRHVLVVAAAAMVLVFQNCAQSADSSLSNQSSQSVDLPFAYKAQVDTIAYMSCSEITNTVEQRAYFTFRAGAYNNNTGGLSITDDFRTKTLNYAATQRAKALSQSDLNANVRLNLAIRQSTNLQVPFLVGPLAVGKDIDSFLPQLDSDVVAGPLAAVTKGQMVNYFPGSQAQRLMEASLRLYQDEKDATTIRALFNTESAMLVAGYSKDLEEMNPAIRVPAGGLATQAYGFGYKVHFAVPASHTAADPRVLSPTGVQEIDLQNGTDTKSTWDCNSAYQFQIVRPEDQLIAGTGTIRCAGTPDPLGNTTNANIVRALRRVLRVEDWYIDPVHACIMPKPNPITPAGGDVCYGGLDPKVTTINYRTSATPGASSCTTTPTSLCPHFVSICIRK